MKSTRRPISDDIETRLLLQCKRRCCICFVIDNDSSHKDGQIAHLDRNPSNNSEDNLAFLCLYHHNRYDSRSRQAKQYTPSEVKTHRAILYAAMAESNRLNHVEVTLRIDKDFDSFSAEERDKLLTQLRRALLVNGDVRIIQQLRGSVKLVLELSRDIAERLVHLVKTGKLADISVTDAHITADADPLSSPVEMKDFVNPILNEMPLFVFLKDTNRRYTFMNAKLADMILETKGDFFGKTDKDFYPTLLAKSYAHDDHMVLSRRAAVDKIELLCPPSGHRMMVHTVKKPVIAPDGSIRGIIGFYYVIQPDLTKHEVQRQMREMTVDLPQAALPRGSVKRPKHLRKK